jgi:hypothetical protein
MSNRVFIVRWITIIIGTLIVIIDRDRVFYTSNIMLTLRSMTSVTRYTIIRRISTTFSRDTDINGTGVFIITVYGPIPTSNLRVTIIFCTFVFIITAYI